MDELERYLARRVRRRQFALTIRHPTRIDTWARLAFDSQQYVARINGRVIEELSSHNLSVSVTGSGLAGVEDRMTSAGWTTPPHSGYSDQRFYFHGTVPREDDRSTYAALARAAAAAVLGTERYLLTIEPYGGQAEYVGESAGYSSMTTMAGFVLGAPIALFVALASRDALDVALVASVLVAMAALYGRRLYRLNEALVRLQATLSESAIVEVPIAGPLIELAVWLAATSIGVWVPISVALVITAAV